MQAIKLSIPGKYWDSYLYEGLLYLFLLDGSVKSYRWDDLSSTLSIDESERLAFDIAFQQSNLLYQDTETRFSNDSEIKTVIFDKFTRLGRKNLVVEGDVLDKILYRQQNNLFPFPHTDLEIYSKKVYVSSKTGIHKATCSRKNKQPISPKTFKIWDCPSLDISASYGNLAIAAGNEGIYELEIELTDYVTENRFTDPTCISAQHVTEVEWSYYSVLGSSHVTGGVFAIQEQTLVSPLNDKNKHSKRRFAGRLVQAEQIFGAKRYTWGAKDKLYQADGQLINVMHFNPFAKDEEEQLQPLQAIRLAEWKGDLISAKVASFGTILELENAIVVVRSDGQIQTIPGEPVQWRVFGRSKHYENQLHIVFEDRLDIYSYNHDAFVDQKSKSAGYFYSASSMLGREKRNRRT